MHSSKCVCNFYSYYKLISQIYRLVGQKRLVKIVNAIKGRAKMVVCGMGPEWSIHFVYVYM
jgi:hypothetical protein